MTNEYQNILAKLKMFENYLKDKSSLKTNQEIKIILKNFKEEVKLLSENFQELENLKIQLKDVNKLNDIYNKFELDYLPQYMCVDFYYILKSAIKNKNSFLGMSHGGNALCKNFYANHNDYLDDVFKKMFNNVYYHLFCYDKENLQVLMNSGRIDFELLNKNNILDRIKDSILKQNPNLKNFNVKDLVTLLRNPLAHESLNDDGVQYLLSEEALKKHENFDNKRKFSIFDNNSYLILKTEKGEQVKISVDEIDAIGEAINIAMSNANNKEDLMIFDCEKCDKTILDYYYQLLQFSQIGFGGSIHAYENAKGLRSDIYNNIINKMLVTFNSEEYVFDENEKKCLLDLMISNFNQYENETLELAILVQHIVFPSYMKGWITNGTLTIIDQLSNYHRDRKLDMPIINMKKAVKSPKHNLVSGSDSRSDLSFFRVKDQSLTFIISHLLGQMQKSNKLQNYAKKCTIFTKSSIEEKETIFRRLRNSCKHGNYIVDRAGGVYLYDTETQGEEKGKREFVKYFNIEDRENLINDIIQYLDVQYFDELVNNIKKINLKADKIIQSISKKEDNTI